MDNQEPRFIRDLLNQDADDFDVYFNLGNPVEGPVERIGAISNMLMAHSYVLRRVLPDFKSELEYRWDIPLSDISPKTFYTILKYCYGFNNLNTHSMPELVDILKAAKKLCMPSLVKDLARVVNDKLSITTITTVLQDSVFLKLPPFQDFFSQLIKQETAKFISCPDDHLLSICPDSMRRIVQMENLQVTKDDVWRFVIKWARLKVFDEHVVLPENVKLFEVLATSRLLQCSLKFSVLCALNLVQLVEEVCLKKSSGQDITDEVKIISIYHTLPVNTPARTLICTNSSDEHHLTHEEFEIKTVNDSSAWMYVIFRKNTELFIYTKSSSVQLHSLFCSGCKKQTGVMNFITSNLLEAEEVGEYPHDYSCEFSVKISQNSSIDGKNKLVMDQRFSERLELDKEFEITLQTEGNPVILSPESVYKVEIYFSSPHPLWFADDVEYFPLPESSKQEIIDIRCGQISKTNTWSGSHIKYLLYREV